MIKNCVVCGKTFEAKTCAKYCPDCREDAYKEINRECSRRFYAAHRGDKLSPPEHRLAGLCKKLAVATTPEKRRKYFRQYVLLKQELSREQTARSD